jgi:uncharacterized membrane protein
MDNLIYIANIILGLSGFFVALNISLKKRDQKPMVCPLNMKCEQVLYSKYAKFLGVPLEIMGMFYYGLITISYSIFLFYPYLKNPFFIFSIFLMTLGGFILSSYLVSVQAFRLREWCSWCLMSAFISTSVFLLSSQTTAINSALTALAYDYQSLIVIIYSLATSLGLGLSITLEVLFLRFLRDLRISIEESSVLNILRQMTWLSLGTMIVSNYAIFIMDSDLLSESPKFLFKVLILFILVGTNLIYDLFISSKLIEIYSDEALKQHIADKYLRAAPFFFAPVSLVSWFSIFMLEMTGDFDLSISQLGVLYISVLTISIMAGGIFSIRTLRRS